MLNEGSVPGRMKIGIAAPRQLHRLPGLMAPSPSGCDPTPDAAGAWAPRAQLNHPDCSSHIPEIAAKFTGPNFDRWAIVLAQMSDERILREKARAAIRSGQLPSRQPDVVIRSQSDRFSGPASRTLCAVCGKGMTSDQMEIEVFFAREEVPTSSDRHVLHVGCFVAWECEREVL